MIQEMRIADLIKKLEEMKNKHCNIKVLAGHFIENEDPDSPCEGHYALSNPILTTDTLVTHKREDGTVAYTYLKSTNPNWVNAFNEEEPVLLVGINLNEEE